MITSLKTSAHRHKLSHNSSRQVHGGELSEAGAPGLEEGEQGEEEGDVEGEVGPGEEEGEGGGEGKKEARMVEGNG